MLFNSLEYLIYLPIVFLLYWFVFRSLKVQNLFVLVASYIFYGWWNWHFLILIAFTSLCSFVSGLLISKHKESGNQRAAWWISFANILINIGILGIYKYYNFFHDSVTELLTMVGFTVNPSSLQLILPVGISFYTFQALGYSIDVYRGKTGAERNIINFFAFLSFFPQLVAGPIEGSTTLLPQFKKSRTFDYAQASDGLRQILWGLFKKMVVADNCAEVVNAAFNNYSEQSGITLIVAIILFAFQVYGDFSGYSDIAIGSAKLFGIKLIRNFHTPFFARSISEFWNLWHISLMHWFLDYIYIPLGGNRKGKAKQIRNILIVYGVSGLWHGANWTFVVWGLLNGFFNVVNILIPGHQKYKQIVAHDRWYPTLEESLKMLLTFVVFLFTLIFFRSETVTDACLYLRDIVLNFNFDLNMVPKSRDCMYFILFMQLTEWLSRHREHGLCLTSEHRWERITLLRWGFYLALAVFILMNCGVSGQFIYFQF